MVANYGDTSEPAMRYAPPSIPAMRSSDTRPGTTVAFCHHVSLTLGGLMGATPGSANSRLRAYPGRHWVGPAGLFRPARVKPLPEARRFGQPLLDNGGEMVPLHSRNYWFHPRPNAGRSDRCGDADPLAVDPFRGIPILTFALRPHRARP
jgi:hypothetical protein